MARVKPDTERGASRFSPSANADTPESPGARSSEDAMRAVWQKHRAGALERLDLIERAVSALTTDSLDEQLRVQAVRAAHSLIGSVGTFGFIHASEVARELEIGLAEPIPSRAQAMSRLTAIVRRELHRDAAAAAHTLPNGAAPDAEVPLRVLLVDDDRQLSERILAEAASREMRCDSAASPEEARALCAKSPPAIVLLDLTFPPDGMADAYALLSELSEATPPIPCSC